MDNNHTHNGINSVKIDAKEAINYCPQSAILTTGSSAGAAYTSTERGIINSHTATLQDIVAKLKIIGITL